MRITLSLHLPLITVAEIVEIIVALWFGISILLAALIGLRGSGKRRI